MNEEILEPKTYGAKWEIFNQISLDNVVLTIISNTPEIAAAVTFYNEPDGNFVRLISNCKDGQPFRDAFFGIMNIMFTEEQVGLVKHFYWQGQHVFKNGHFNLIRDDKNSRLLFKSRNKTFEIKIIEETYGQIVKAFNIEEEISQQIQKSKITLRTTNLLLANFPCDGSIRVFRLRGLLKKKKEFLLNCEYCFLKACMNLLDKFFCDRRAMEFSEEFWSGKEYAFDEHVEASIAFADFYQHFQYIAHINQETATINRKIYNSAREILHAFQAIDFIKPKGPDLAVKILEDFLNNFNFERDKKGSLRDIQSFFGFDPRTKFTSYEYKTATCSDISDPSFTHQFVVPYIIEFTEAEHDVLINTIAHMSEKNLKRHIEEITFYFYNYNLQKDRIIQIKTLPAVERILRSSALKNNSLLTITVLLLFAESMPSLDGEDAFRKLYDTIWPWVGSVWCIENRDKIRFRSQAMEEFFDIAIAMLSNDFFIENHNPELSEYLKKTPKLCRRCKDLESLAFLLRLNDMNLSSSQTFERMMNEACYGELYDGKKVFKLLCVVSSLNQDLNRDLVDELFDKNSPIQKFKNNFVTYFDNNSLKESLEYTLNYVLDNFSVFREVAGEKNIPKIFQTICEKAGDIGNIELVSELAREIYKEKLDTKHNLQLKLKFAKKKIRIKEVRECGL